MVRVETTPEHSRARLSWNFFQTTKRGDNILPPHHSGHFPFKGCHHKWQWASQIPSGREPLPGPTGIEV